VTDFQSRTGGNVGDEKGAQKHPYRQAVRHIPLVLLRDWAVVNLVNCSLLAPHGRNRAFGEMEVNENYFGASSMTIARCDVEEAVIPRAVARTVRMFATHDAKLIEDTQCVARHSTRQLRSEPSAILAGQHQLRGYVIPVRTGDGRNPQRSPGP
jgi:hypothetical protein